MLLLEERDFRLAFPVGRVLYLPYDPHAWGLLDPRVSTMA
jgi:hypothetical protein